MINLYDHNAIDAIVKSRQGQFLKEAEQYRINRQLEPEIRRRPGRFRRAVGMSLIQAGARISGASGSGVRQSAASS